MRIAVIADTHGKVHPSLNELTGEADEIWHLGDVCDETTLRFFENAGPPVKVVRGNCDGCMEWPLTLDFSLCGFRIRLVHIPPRQAPPGVQILLHGHTHVPRDEMVGSTRFLNPGCVTRPNRGAPASFAWLKLEEGEAPDWKLRLLR